MSAVTITVPTKEMERVLHLADQNVNKSIWHYGSSVDKISEIYRNAVRATDGNAEIDPFYLLD